jgi:xylulose-5-phosphate/fructose-6-phosphate phosphoketolase
MGSVLSRDELDAVDAYWRAANYLSVGQIYLLDNPLLRLPLLPEHIKPRLLGWGTTPGLNFTYVHLNRRSGRGGFTEPDFQFRATTLSERIRHEA